VIALVLSNNALQLIEELTVYSFYGIAYLGIPMALYTLLSSQTRFVPMRGVKLAALFGLGCVSAIVVLSINPNAGWHLLIAPILWAVILLTRWLKEEDRLDQVVAGGALALGFAAFWLRPPLLPLPFVQFIQDWQLHYIAASLGRSGLQLSQLWFTAAALIAGVVVAWIISWRRSAARWLLVAACAIAFGFIVPQLPDMATPAAAPVANAPEPTPTPIAIVSTPVAGWIATSLGTTSLQISVPPDWHANPKGSQGELINLVPSEGDLIFSVSLFDGITDTQSLIQSANDVRHANFSDYQIDLGPELRSVNGHDGLWLEWSSASNATRGADAYLMIPQGVLQFSLWCEPNTFTQRRAVFTQIVGSLH
jgi:hypothetical protein